MVCSSPRSWGNNGPPIQAPVNVSMVIKEFGSHYCLHVAAASDGHINIDWAGPSVAGEQRGREGSGMDRASSEE